MKSRGLSVVVSGSEWSVAIGEATILLRAGRPREGRERNQRVAAAPREAVGGAAGHDGEAARDHCHVAPTEAQGALASDDVQHQLGVGVLAVGPRLAHLPDPRLGPGAAADERLLLRLLAADEVA